MTQFDYTGTWKDSFELLRCILASSGNQLIPDLKYDEPCPRYISALTMDDWLVLQSRRSLFIWSQDVSQTAISFTDILDGPNKGKYVIDPTGGGPLLHLTLPACYRESDLLNVSVGILSFPRSWYNASLESWEPADNTLIKWFRATVDAMKGALVKYKTPSGNHIWIGRDAVGSVKANTTAIKGFGQA